KLAPPTVICDRLAINKFHHEVRPSVLGRAAVEEARNVRMIERGQNLPLAHETLTHKIRIHPPPDELDGDLLLELIVIPHGFINCTHPAAPDHTRETVRADAVAREIVV